MVNVAASPTTRFPFDDSFMIPDDTINRRESQPHPEAGLVRGIERLKFIEPVLD
jgi:hypothetical protein